jgi:hypothetical protein
MPASGSLKPESIANRPDAIQIVDTPNVLDSTVSKELAHQPDQTNRTLLSFFMDSHFLLVRTVATLARRQIALEALLQGKGISKENIAEAAGQVPIPQIIPTHFPIASHYQEELEEILKALGQ